MVSRWWLTRATLVFPHENTRVVGSWELAVPEARWCRHKLLALVAHAHVPDAV